MCVRKALRPAFKGIRLPEEWKWAKRELPEKEKLPGEPSNNQEIQAFQRRSAFIGLWSQIDGLARTSEVRSSFSLARAFFARAIFFERVSGIHASGFLSPVPPGTEGQKGATGSSPNQLGGRELSISECYFAVKGTALVLPHDESMHVYRCSNNNVASLESCTCLRRTLFCPLLL
ncbi:hypothetical protein HPB47_006751 [Ixodes persulcatus]|uniref:Uncharacterized protein n=1 Tax=Ixodes persulcatus TaxID=34615 RepID=A0AC60P9H0_IXOPE|nr:hypothetical protein HPB47_006751 [Ixodes persulcatus]